MIQVDKNPYEYKGPHKVNPHTFEVGAIATSSWGYDQTNVNFWVVTKRTKTQVTLEELQPLTINHTGGMSGEAVPGEVWTELKDKERILVRKIQRTDKGKEYAKMRPTYGVIHPWDGNPKYCSWYY